MAWFVDRTPTLGLPNDHGRAAGDLPRTATFIAPLPRDPQLTGVEFHARAFVPWAGAGNAARALVTNSIVATIGSR